MRTRGVGPSLSFAASSRTLPSVGLGSAPALSFFSFSFFFDLTPALLKATSNCLDDAPRTGRLLLDPAEGWPEFDDPGVGVGVDMDAFPCEGRSDGLGSGLGGGCCFWDSCFCGCWRGSLGGFGGGFVFGMIVGTGVDALAAVFFAV